MSATALILAAGEGTRMKSATPKVAHAILGEPLVRYVVDAARDAGCERIVVITGHSAEEVENLLEDVECVRQSDQLGTGHAVMCARDSLSGFEGSLLVLSGDTPLLQAETLAGLVAMRETSGAALTLLTTHLHDPSGYGRIVRDRDGAVEAIVEHKDLAPEQHELTEVNTGTYCFDASTLFAHLHRLSSDNAQGEFYLTDMVTVFRSEGLAVAAVTTDEPGETMGVNTRIQLAEASRVLQGRINERHMLAGVTIVDPASTWIEADVEIAADVTIQPFTVLRGATKIQTGAQVGPHVVAVDAEIGPGVTVGPFAYLRPGTVLGEGAKAGTFVELKKARIGARSKVPHLSYIGDAEIGEDTNIAAGNITANFPHEAGKPKGTTRIGSNVRTGVDNTFDAPVSIGDDAWIAAGSVIKEDVPPGSLAGFPPRQETKEGWVYEKYGKPDDAG